MRAAAVASTMPPPHNTTCQRRQRMYVAIRSTLAVLSAMIAVVVLGAALTSQAKAATATVVIVQPKKDGTGDLALTAIRTVPPKPNVRAMDRTDAPNQRWIKHDVFDGYATYESVKFPGKCIEVLSTASGEPLTLGFCQSFNNN